MLSFNVETKQYFSVAPSQKGSESETEINTLEDVTSEVNTTLNLLLKDYLIGHHLWTVII